MFRFARKSGLLLAALTASLSMSSIARADNPQLQYQTYQQYAQPTNNQPQYQPVQNQNSNQQNQQNSNQQFQHFAPQPPVQQEQPVQRFQNQNQNQNQQLQNQQYQQTSTFNQTAQNTAAEDRLSDDQLGGMLRQLGYNVTPLQNNANGTSFSVKIERGDWHFTITVGISSDHTNVWLSQSLTKLPEGNSLSTAALLKLMEWNATSTSIFSYEPSNGNRLLIARPIANHAVSSDKLRSMLENFVATIEQTESMWTEKALVAPNMNSTAMR